MKLISIACCLFISLLSQTCVYSQTTMSLGDIAFTGYNSDGTDNFSFMILRSGGITNNTVIRFTDYGWSAGACGTNGWGATVEEEITWTASGALPYGTQVVINGLTSSNGTVTGTAMNLSAGGDQLFAYQGTRTGAHTLLAAIHMNFEIGLTSATNWDNVGAPTGTQSNRPPCLITGTHALFFDPEVDNARLKTSVVITNNAATDRATINNPANWDTDDINPFPLPPVFSTLPVKFTYLSITDENVNVKLKWGIAEEQDIERYVVERSTDGTQFTDAGSLFSSGLPAYEWTEPVPTTTAFYRVRAEEFSGKRIYTSIIRFTGKKEMPSIRATTDGNELILRTHHLPESSYQVIVYNSSGQALHRSIIRISGSTGNYTLSMKAIGSNQIYYVRLESGEFRYITRLLSR